MKRTRSQFIPRACRIASVLLALLIAAVAAPPLRAQDKPSLDITGYVINAQLTPKDHTLNATAQVTFTALEDLPTASFQLHGMLRITQVTDASGATLNGERGANDAILITPASPLVKGQSYTWTFAYSGPLTGGNGGPVEGLKLASVEDPVSYLLYAGAWFPMTGYLTDRFTAEMHITVPTGYTVIGSGSDGQPKTSGDTTEYDFKWTKPGFPGTILAGKWTEMPAHGAPNIHMYVLPAHKAAAEGDYGRSALDEFAYFTSTFGLPESNLLNVVEIPNDTVPAYWAPQIAAVAGAHIGGKTDFRLLANTIAHQWWSSEVSPATLDDAWITNGMCRYGELLYLEDQQGHGALESALQDVAAGALAYDTTPLTSAGRLGAFSPAFQSMTFEKGAMVLNMLRWEVGDDSFLKIVRETLSQYLDKGVSTQDFEKLAEAQSQKQLMPFFSEWVEGTGAPEFTNKWAMYRLGNGKGFRIIGEVQQPLDLFNMPVDIRVETDGKTVNQIVDVVGNNTQYTIDTFGRPRRILIDPEGNVLENSPEMQVRVDILRGQQLAAEGDTAGALAAYQKALSVNPQSSLASFRIGELLFQQHNYQAAVNAYRDALNGDDQPRWTEVWSHIEIGKIFDITGQRDRAVNEYREAVQTNDNTAGAMNEARHDIQVPYKQPS
jgi:aminopeptidase N